MLTNSRKIIKRLKDDGWEDASTKGSHKHFTHPDKPGKITVPHPKKDLPKGTVASIYRAAGWDPD